MTPNTLLADTLPSFLDIHPTVAHALENKLPLVALESTIITHGMPYPQNAQMALAVEQIITEGGATPVLMAVLDGRIKIGLSDEDRDALAQTKDARKASRADLAFAVSKGESAGTTVAATMMIARMVGIKVFATGGIGGVHEGASESFDVSADLQELSRTDVIVVAAGAKAILDIPKTLEVLETNGVPVVGYQTNVMPAFWSRTSEHAIPLRIDSAQAIADFQRTRKTMSVTGGMLIANPIPAEDEIPQHVMATHIAQAQADLERLGVTGKEVTPYLLSRILELTEGASLTSNIALVKNNARLATQIAKSLT